MGRLNSNRPGKLLFPGTITIGKNAVFYYMAPSISGFKYMASRIYTPAPAR